MTRNRIKKMDLDERQTEFILLYCNPKSETFGNAYQSAVKAGYSDEYARVITSRSNQIMSEIEIRRERMLEKAERNLDEFLDLNPMIDAIGQFGPIKDKKTGEVYKRYSTGVAALKFQATTFTAETLGKKNYSKKHDFGFIDPSTLQLTDAEKAEIMAIYQENLPKQLSAPQTA